MINETDYVDLGLACADVCKTLDRGMRGRRVDELSQDVFKAVEQLTTSVKLSHFVRNLFIMLFQSQDCSRDPGEDSHAGPTKRDLSPLSRKE